MRILLYAPDLPGHPQIYCRVITRALLNAPGDHEVFIANPADKAGWMKGWPVLRPLVDEMRVHAIDVSGHSSPAGGLLTAEQIIDLQQKHKIDATLFIEAGKSEREFRRIAAGQAPRWRGRVCGIFDRTCEWYPGEDPYTGAVVDWNSLPLRQKLGRIRNSLFRANQSTAYFYEQVLIKSRTVDAVIVKDERVARRFGHPVSWMPEIFRVFDEETAPGPDYFRFSGAIEEFTRRAGADNVLLYFGTGAWYKGYDWFLKLAQLDRETFALHAGAPDRRESGKPYDFEIEPIRSQLIAEGRLFETQSFVESDALVKQVFSSIKRFASTHRLTLSSGTCLQALEQGKPVLTPSAGLVGWRTLEFNLGAVYSYGSMDAMLESWRDFRQGRMDPAPDAISSFTGRFSREATEAYFVKLLTAEIHSQTQYFT